MTIDSSYVGRYGTLSLMKKDGSNIPIAHYPIDDEEITIGRDPNCSVRLYYDTISKLHCKVTFEDSKAFLTVYGTSGLVSDGFPLFPTATGPTTVPLGNNTEIEIHHKLFIFTYPPKDLRAMILATPEPDRNGNRRKTLRMSMIASAMVFTPRPSQDPRENLRTLQSPLKQNYSSPLKPTHNEEPEEEDIVLVESNHPDVVQDDEDNLVILESVQAPEPLESPRRFVQFTPQPHHYQTPLKNPRNSLHRAVLIRSAQRTAKKIEIEEEQEAMEVEDVVTELEETNLGDGSPEGDDDNDAMEEDAPADEEMNERLEEQEADEEQEESDVLRPLGPFMTPQPSVRASSVLSSQSGLSVQGPQRIRVMQPWRVKDLVVLPPSTTGVKKEDPEPKGHISEEEKSAIRARRKSAFRMPDPADSQIPGSRRMSTIAQPPPTATPSAPLPSKKPFIKPDPNPPEEEEDTDVLLEKVKAKIVDLRRQQGIGLGPPPLERQRSRSPTKQDAESLFWGSDSVTSTRIDQGGDEANVGTAHPQDEGEDTYNDEVEEQEVIQQTTPVKSWKASKAKLPPKTPKMDGMRGLFADPRTIPPTPTMDGIRQLFNEPVEPQTPAYGEVRDMFKTTVAPALPGTPILEGVGDLLATPAAYRKQSRPLETMDVSVDTVTADSEVVVPGTKAAAAVRKRNVVAEAKQLAEKPASPTTSTTTGATRPLKIGRPTSKKSLKEAVSLPRPTRTKKVADEAGPSQPVPSSEPARRTRTATAEAEEQSQTAGAAGSKIVRRTRRTPDVPSNPPPTRVTRGRTTPTPTEEVETTTATTKKPSSSSNARTTPRRGTRNTPVPDEDQSDPAPAPKKSTRGRRVETIKEEEDDASVPSQTTTHKGTLAKKSQFPARSRTTATEKDTPAEKENEPSDSVDDSQIQGAPPTRQKRTVTKASTARADSKEPKATTSRSTRATRSKATQP